MPQAKRLVASGATFVDIRTPDNFAAERIPEAVSVPLFVPVEGTETFDRIKKFVMATAFAMQATGVAPPQQRSCVVHLHSHRAHQAECAPQCWERDTSVQNATCSKSMHNVKNVHEF